jgi:subtilisin family serine protease
MYRVFGCGPSTEDDVIIQAMLRAASDGVDVISISLGEPWEDETTDPYSIITSKLVAQGIAVFASNRNAADSGVQSLSTPAIGADVFAVGSVDNEKFPVTFQYGFLPVMDMKAGASTDSFIFRLTDSNGRHLRYSSHLPQDSPLTGLIVQVMNYGSDDPLLLSGPSPGEMFEDTYQDALKNLTAASIDPSTVVLAAEWGDVVPESKAQYAATLGYKHFLSYATTDNDPFFGQGYYVSDPELSWPIEPLVFTVQDSRTLLTSYGRHPLQYKIFASSTNYAAKSTTAITGGFMSNFSSIGPTDQMNLKPQLSAPGGNILSLWPLSYDGYAILSGTSMATPYMAASYALIKSHRPNLTVNQIYALMQNSGAILPWYFNHNIKTAAVQQGAGLLNVHNALSWESYVTPRQLNAGFSSDWVTWNNSITMNLTITNLSPRSKTYRFSHTPAGMMQDLWWEQDTVNNMYPYYATVNFHVDSVVVPAGSSGIVSLDILAPVPNATWGDDAIDLLNPVYSGFIVVKNNFEMYTVPYVGQLWNATRFGG